MSDEHHIGDYSDAEEAEAIDWWRDRYSNYVAALGKDGAKGCARLSIFFEELASACEGDRVYDMTAEWYADQVGELESALEMLQRAIYATLDDV